VERFIFGNHEMASGSIREFAIDGDNDELAIEQIVEEALKF
jgi:hypothetical protein